MSKKTPTLSVAYIVRDEKEYIRESLLSIKDVADEIVIVMDPRSKDGTEEIIKETLADHPKTNIETRTWTTGTEQKSYAFELATQEFVLFLDGDEVMSDNAAQLKKTLQTYNFDAYNIRSHHLINHLAEEDAMVKKHWHAGRLVRNDKDLFCFEGVNHAILKNKKEFKLAEIEDVRIFHFGYVKHLHKIAEKYERDMKIQQLHTPSFLKKWKDAHVMGGYPTQQINPADLPGVILKKFHLENLRSRQYFHTRMALEAKHYQDVIAMKKLFNPKNALFLGCGAGQRVYAASQIGIRAKGIDKDDWIVKRNPYKTNIHVGDILELDEDPQDLVICYDLLEHLRYEDLDKALINIKNISIQFLFSIPFVGDPNLYKDPTHLICEEEEWWKNKLKQHGFRIKPTPEWFPYHKQIIIADIAKKDSQHTNQQKENIAVKNAQQ